MAKRQAAEKLERMTTSFKLPKDLHQRLKIASAVQRREMSDIVAEALVAHLDKPAMRSQGAARGAK